MKFKLTVLSSFFMGLFSLNLAAQMSPPSPHVKMKAETGVISGTLLKDGKTPLSEHEVKLEIMKGNDFILAIPKATDSKGQYQFKNIFQTDEFSYAIETVYEGEIYRSDFISLKSGEKLRKLDLIVGQGAKTAPPLSTASADVEKKPALENTRSNEYVLLAVIASIVAAGYAIYKRKNK